MGRNLARKGHTLITQRALVRNTIAVCALNFCFTSFQSVSFLGNPHE